MSVGTRSSSNVVWFSLLVACAGAPRTAYMSEDDLQVAYDPIRLDASGSVGPFEDTTGYVPHKIRLRPGTGCLPGPSGLLSRTYQPRPFPGAQVTLEDGATVQDPVLIVDEWYYGNNGRACAEYDVELELRNADPASRYQVWVEFRADDGVVLYRLGPFRVRGKTVGRRARIGHGRIPWSKVYDGWSVFFRFEVDGP